jgi:hypothetical protein
MIGATDKYREFVARYQECDDMELLQLAASAGDLTEAAQEALKSEMGRRNLSQPASVVATNRDTRLTPLISSDQRPWITRFWPRISSHEEAIRVLKSGGILAAAQGTLTAGLSVYLAYAHTQFAGLNGYSIIDAALFWLISWRLFRRSLGWSIFAVLFEAANVASHLQDHVGNVIVGIVLSLIYINALRGAIYFRNRPAISKEERL